MKKYAQAIIVEYSYEDTPDEKPWGFVIKTNIECQPLAAALTGVRDEEILIYTEDMSKEYLLKNFGIKLRDRLRTRDKVFLQEESIYAEVRNDFFDGMENIICIDAWMTDDDDEEGETVAKIHTANGNIWVEELEENVLRDPGVAEAVAEAVKEFENSGATA